MTTERQQRREREWLLRDKYNGKKSVRFLWDVLRLKSGVPLAYVIGDVPFLGCTIDLSYRPLIPRAETEFWVERTIEEMNKGSDKLNVLDLFSGSGCIGIAILRHVPHADVDLGEKDPRLIAQIRKNIEINDIKKGRFTVFETDCFSGIPKKRYDYILANPPYLSRKRTKSIQSSVISHEPHEALFADEGGLALIRKTVGQADEYLTETGRLVIECDPHQTTDIASLAQKSGFVCETRHDQFGNARTILLTRVPQTS